MNKKLIILVLLFCLGCSKQVDLNKNLKNILIDYQNKFPIPNKSTSNKKKIYIYSAYFWQNKKDTLVVITRSSMGIVPNTKGFGIYQDSELKPTFIIDENNLSKRFILKKINDVESSLYWHKKSFSENFPPLYTYLIKKEKLKLIKVDTVWNHWD